MLLLKNVRMKNYRLTELAADAYGLCKQINDEGRNVVLTDEWMKRYGELIVRECVTKMALEIMNNSWIDDAVKNTYEHFGIEDDDKDM